MCGLIVIFHEADSGEKELDRVIRKREVNKTAVRIRQNYRERGSNRT